MEIELKVGENQLQTWQLTKRGKRREKKYIKAGNYGKRVRTLVMFIEVKQKKTKKRFSYENKYLKQYAF